MNIIWFDVNVFIYLFILFTTRSSKSELKTKKCSHFKKVLIIIYLSIYLNLKTPYFCILKMQKVVLPSSNVVQMLKIQEKFNK